MATAPLITELIDGDVFVTVPMNATSTRRFHLDLVTHIGGNKFRLKSEQALIVLDFVPNGPNRDREFMLFMKSMILMHNVYSVSQMIVPQND